MFSSKTVLQIEMITIEDDGLHLIVETEVNDLKCRLLIDTGASRTVFDRTRIFNYVTDVELEDHDKLSTGLGTDSMPTSSTTLKQFKIGDVKIKKLSRNTFGLVTCKLQL